MNATVVYHSADYDGIFCREIARKFLPDATLIGWNFGDAPLAVPAAATYILDLPVDRVLGFDFAKTISVIEKFKSVEAIKDFNQRLVWIDHHKSSIESHPKDIPGYRIDGVAACRLAWQWFTDDGGCVYPSIAQPYIDRDVEEPLAVRLAGEYDIWDKRDPRAETFQYGLRSVDLDAPPLPGTNSSWWRYLLDKAPLSETMAAELIQRGENCQSYQQKIDADLVKHRSYRLSWEGLNWLVLNTGRFNSLTFAALDVPETGHDALMGYMFNGKQWTVSLYHAKHRTDLDLSQIAVKHGGGGHQGACGFTCNNLPFMP